MYEGGIAENLNREDGIIGSGADGAQMNGDLSNGLAETTMVQKHTMETLMAGEKIIEALELADGEAEAQKKYAEALERLPPSERGKIGPPARNPVLIALDLEPETHVLRTVERVHASALYDALLVIPFSKVTSLFHYMDIWASQVRFSHNGSSTLADEGSSIGHCNDTNIEYSSLSFTDPRIADCRHSFFATAFALSAGPPSRCADAAEVTDRVQSCRTQVY